MLTHSVIPAHPRPSPIISVSPIQPTIRGPGTAPVLLVAGAFVLQPIILDDEEAYTIFLQRLDGGSIKMIVIQLEVDDILLDGPLAWLNVNLWCGLAYQNHGHSFDRTELPPMCSS